jgi:hypothetical protein
MASVCNAQSDRLVHLIMSKTHAIDENAPLMGYVHIEDRDIAKALASMRDPKYDQWRSVAADTCLCDYDVNPERWDAFHTERVASIAHGIKNGFCDTRVEIVALVGDGFNHSHIARGHHAIRAYIFLKYDQIPILAQGCAATINWLTQLDAPSTIPAYVSGSTWIYNVTLDVSKIYQVYADSFKNGDDECRVDRISDKDIETIISINKPTDHYETRASKEANKTASYIKDTRAWPPIRILVSILPGECNGTIVDGHHRLRAATYLGLKTIQADVCGHMQTIDWMRA